MSRSYKHNYFIIQEKEDYHYLNRKLRRDKLAKIPKGSAYKRHDKHWNTWKYIWTWEDAKKTYYEWAHYYEKYTLEEWYQKWRKWCVRK
jgi:hypothetical protein